MFDGAEGGKWVQELRKELERQEKLPPPPVDSASSTRYSTPLGNTPGRKREILDICGDERVLKRTKSD
jgi:hypothetical protein